VDGYARAVGGLWSMLGVGVGLAVRHQVSVIVGALIWYLLQPLLEQFRDPI
jgi:hypothetical protein